MREVFEHCQLESRPRGGPEQKLSIVYQIKCCENNIPSLEFSIPEDNAIHLSSGFVIKSRSIAIPPSRQVRLILVFQVVLSNCGNCSESLTS